MTILLRSRQQIAKMREAGRLVAETFELLRPHIRPGVTTRELDQMAEKYIRSRGATPAYKGYKGFPATICVAPNNVICHGFPSKTPLAEGDIVGIDIGARLNGWYGDACVTYPVGQVAPEAAKLLEVAEEAMWRGIRAARAGQRLGDVGAAIQTYVEANGRSVVREWTGHGVGEKLHEDPSVPHFGKPGSGILLRPGLIFTVEPMVNAGHYETVLDKKDGWTVRTADGSLSAQFEHSIVIADNGPEILTLP
ncbi:MAG TPA: type I methionyl aminopeptidase [Roseiflexaceae bacterium]|nr:type I methionyl aminopeptidase [Roseiflexaceae bacterium]